MLLWALILILLNSADGVLTWLSIGAGTATEWNPLMRHLYSWSPTYFLLFKLLVVNLIIVAIYMWSKRSELKHMFLAIASIPYAYILLFHAYGIYITRS